LAGWPSGKGDCGGRWRLLAALREAKIRISRGQSIDSAALI